MFNSVARVRALLHSVSWETFFVGYYVGIFLALLSIEAGKYLHDRMPVRPAPPIYPADVTNVLPAP